MRSSSAWAASRPCFSSARAVSRLCEAGAPLPAGEAAAALHAVVAAGGKLHQLIEGSGRAGSGAGRRGSGGAGPPPRPARPRRRADAGRRPAGADGRAALSHRTVLSHRRARRYPSRRAPGAPGSRGGEGVKGRQETADTTGEVRAKGRRPAPRAGEGERSDGPREVLSPPAPRHREGRVRHPLPGRQPPALPLQRQPRRAPLQGADAGEDTEEIARLLLEGDERGAEMAFNELDLAYELPGEGRFRVNISRQRRFFNIVLRVIPLEIKTFEELNLPGTLRDLAHAAARLRARHRRHRHGQVDDARGDDQRDQPRAPLQDRDGRGPDRVRLQARQEHHHAARDRDRHRVASRRRCAPPCARTPT